MASGRLVAVLSFTRLPLTVRYHVTVSFLPFGIAAKWNLAQTAFAPVSVLAALPERVRLSAATSTTPSGGAASLTTRPATATKAERARSNTS